LPGREQPYPKEFMKKNCSFKASTLIDLTLENILKMFRISPIDIIPLKGDGSDRKFFRIILKKGTVILILPQAGELGKKEAYSYYKIGKYLKENQIPVPEIFDYDEELGLLFVEDLGDLRLYDIVDSNIKKCYYKKAIENLVKFQGLIKHFDPFWSYDPIDYDLQFLWEKEVLYFKEWYVERYKNEALSYDYLNELKICLQHSLNFKYRVLLHRDYQSKNLMIKKGKIYIIDFQGTRIGPPWYDLASLLYDPYLKDWDLDIDKFLDYYIELSGYDETSVISQVYYFAVVRLMQALAAYVKLSYMGKDWFKNYIKFAESKLIKILNSYKFEEPLRGLLKFID
jgi:aminoglycoside/choline kinase family phosphotransferase